MIFGGKFYRVPLLYIIAALYFEFFCDTIEVSLQVYAKRVSTINFADTLYNIEALLEQKNAARISEELGRS